MSQLQNTKKGLSAATLKMIAIVGMTLDHIGIIFGHSMPLAMETAFFALGGLTFPIMAYFISEGYQHTTDFKQYALRLFGFAVLAEIPYKLAFGENGNVLFTLLLGLLVLYAYDHIEQKSVFYALFMFTIAVSFAFDWGGIGVPIVVLYYKLRGGTPFNRVVIPFFVVAAMGFVNLVGTLYLGLGSGVWSGLPSVAFVFVGGTLTIPLLLRYNGEKGMNMKYFFYLYYPAHLLLLWGIAGIQNGIWL